MISKTVHAIGISLGTRRRNDKQSHSPDHVIVIVLATKRRHDKHAQRAPLIVIALASHKTAPC